MSMINIFLKNSSLTSISEFLDDKTKLQLGKVNKKTMEFAVRKFGLKPRHRVHSDIYANNTPIVYSSSYSSNVTKYLNARTLVLNDKTPVVASSFGTLENIEISCPAANVVLEKFEGAKRITLNVWTPHNIALLTRRKTVFNEICLERSPPINSVLDVYRAKHIIINKTFLQMNACVWNMDCLETECLEISNSCVSVNGDFALNSKTEKVIFKKCLIGTPKVSNVDFYKKYYVFDECTFGSKEEYVYATMNSEMKRSKCPKK